MLQTLTLFAVAIYITFMLVRNEFDVIEQR